MKSVLDFLGVDVDALKKEKRKILINGVGITQYFMLLRFATRKVDVSGFYIDDFESDKPYYLANKRIYGKCDIENDGNEYLLVKCERNHPTPGGGVLYNIEITRIASPKNDECIVYGAGFQGMAARQLLEDCGVTVLKFCDRDNSRWHSEHFGKEIISPNELKENYSNVPVIIGLDPYIAETAAEELYRDNIISEAYLSCDPVFSIPDAYIRNWTKLSKKRNVFLGKYQSLLPRLSVLKFLGIEFSYIADIEGEIPAENTNIEVRSPYDLCYENASELSVFIEAPYRNRGSELLINFGLSESCKIYLARKDTHIILDPNLGHNIEYKSESSVIKLSTKNSQKTNIITVTGGSTSEVCLCDEISWPEQFVSIAEKNNVDVSMLAGGTRAYIVGQEIVKFLRDISFKKTDILISYSGYNELLHTDENHFVSKYQTKIFTAFNKKFRIAPSEPNIELRLNVPQGIENMAEHWLHYERMMYAMCKELGIKFYAILQPNLSIKKNLSFQENMIMIDFFGAKKDYKEMTLLFQKTVLKHKKIYPWLHDFSHIFDDHPETVYFDSCHLTSYGNRILAEKIFELVKKDLR